MIKKFDEFNEKKEKLHFGHREVPLIESDEIDDQFLRLKEIFNCSVTWKYLGKNPICVCIIISPGFDEKSYDAKDLSKRRPWKNNYKEIYKEIENIKIRFESIYKVDFVLRTPDRDLSKSYNDNLSSKFYSLFRRYKDPNFNIVIVPKEMKRI